MICRTCRRPYAHDDAATAYPGSGPPFHGWHHAFGECFLCFCYAIFGGLMGPSDSDDPQPIYDIRPIETWQRGAADA